MTYRLTDAEMVRLYAAGEDAMTIGLKAGCSNTTVIKILRNAGVTIRTRGCGRAKRSYRAD